jgi:hypothetical protein
MTAPSEAAPAPARASRVAVVALLLCVAGVLGVFAARMRAPSPRPQPGNVLLDETLDLAKGGPAGVSRRVRVKDPAVLDVAVDPWWGAGPLEFSFGPPQPAKPVESGPASDLPDPESPLTVTWTADAASPRKAFPVLAPGLYVLHVVPRDPLKTGGVWVTVRALPPR